MTLRNEAMTVLKELEELDAKDSHDGTPKERRVRCITPTVGRLLYFLVLIRRPKCILELGTSAGYSTIWLASAAREIGGHVISVERDPLKIDWANSNLERAGLRDVVELRLDDVISVIEAEPGPFDFMFMDHKARLYLDSFISARPKLSRGSVIVTDGWGTVERWQTEPTLARYADFVEKDQDFATFLLPVEKGELIAIRL